MKYLSITVVTTTEFSDIVSSVLIDGGSEGVVIKDSNDIKETLQSGKNWDYVDDSLLEMDSRVFVTGFYDESALSGEIIDAISQLAKEQYFSTGSLETSVEMIDSQDWENVWKQYYKPIECGKITIVPKWLKHENENLYSFLASLNMPLICSRAVSCVLFSRFLGSIKCWL